MTTRAMIVSLIFSVFFFACSANLSPPGRENTNPPTIYFKLIGSEEQNEITAERLVRIGKIIIFGTEDPRAVLARREMPIGRGQCPLCHRFFSQGADRGPALIAVEARSHFRIKEERYQMFAKLHSDGEPNSGLKPRAQTGGEYLLESEYCPNCYSVRGFGVGGSRDLESPMLIISKPPIGLTDFQIVAVVAYLQSHDTPGDNSKVTVVEDWERYFGKKLPITPEDIYLATHLQFPPAGPSMSLSLGPPIALSSDTPEQIVKKMACYVCHQIPGISVAKTGMIGPLLIMKTSAAARIQSPEYLKAVKKGRAHARTPREYVIESITTPGAFIVPGFADDMLRDFSHKFTLAGLDKLVDYLMEQDEAAAVRAGLDRVPDEEEGSLLIKKSR